MILFNKCRPPYQIVDLNKKYIMELRFGFIIAMISFERVTCLKNLN
jgi:uncharacterized membrane protein